jgi:3-oxoacyl-[acyl-carrier protein] reductase
MTQDLKGKVAIVTGSSSGIGAATAIKLARRGAGVVINYSKSEDEARNVVTACEEAGGEAIMVQGNVAEDADCRKLAQAALDRWGRIDILVNNAGTTKFADHADLEALDAEDFIYLYRINTIGPYQMIRACLPAMKKQGRGSVVNVSSIAGVEGIGSSVAYAASKGALNIMTKSLARALAPEIRLNAVCPGFVGTPWFEKRFGKEGLQKVISTVEEATPLRRAGTAEEIADAIVFFAVEGAELITGEALLVDAGTHLGSSLLVPRR